MAGKPAPNEPPLLGPSCDAKLKTPQFSSPDPATAPSLKPEFPPSGATTSTRPPPLHPSPDADIVHVPSYSRWFSWENIHECEVRFLPEFFDSSTPSKNPRVYKYYRNCIIKQFRDNPLRKITFTDVRKTLVGDVGSIRRVFDFLELWGLVNYSTSAPTRPLRWEDSKEAKSGGDGSSLESSAQQPKETTRRLCSGCKSVCTIACFTCDKYDLTLCARCYVRGNYRVGVSNADFRRVEISEEIKTDWAEKDTLQLLEAIMHHGDDWKRVAQHVGARSEKDCITHFIKLPFGEEFVGYPDSKNNAECGPESNKRMRLTPLADASNPIMAQAAFLSAVAGEEIAEAAARAAVTSVYEVEKRASKGNQGSLAKNTNQEVAAASNGEHENKQNTLEKSYEDANAVVEEEQDMERAILGIIQVQMKKIQEKIVRFEEFDLQMEKEWQQIERMKGLLFSDQLNLLFHRNAVLKTEDRIQENVKTDVVQ